MLAYLGIGLAAGVYVRVTWLHVYTVFVSIGIGLDGKDRNRLLLGHLIKVSI